MTILRGDEVVAVGRQVYGPAPKYLPTIERVEPGDAMPVNRGLGAIKDGVPPDVAYALIQARYACDAALRDTPEKLALAIREQRLKETIAKIDDAMRLIVLGEAGEDAS